MLDKKVKYAITSLAFNQNNEYLAVSSYSSDVIEICKIENDAIKTEKEIKLKGENNPINSLIWSNNFLICINDNSKQISKIDFQTGSTEAEFTHEHSRGFESIDRLNLINGNKYLVSSKKIHPPTIEKLNINISHKDLENIFILDDDLKLLSSCSVPGNIIQARFYERDQSIIVISKYLDGTTLYILDMLLNIKNKIKITDGKALSAFIAVNSEISVLLQINKDEVRTDFIRLNESLSRIEEHKEFKDSKFSLNNPEYINSVFGYKNILVTEVFTRKDSKSYLKYFDLDQNKLVETYETYGFMEAMAFSEKFTAWAENNKIKVIENV